MRRTEIAAGVGVVCLLLALLTWLLARSIATDVAQYSTTLRTFDDFALAEASLHRDVLGARAGLLLDYDPLVRSSDEIVAAVSQLRAQAATEGLEAGPVDRLAAAVKIEEELTERFKTDNALLRNSLSYIGLLTTSPGFNDPNFRLEALAAAILELTVDPSPRSQQAVQDRLLELAVQTPVDAADPRTAQALISHAGLLKNLLPSVNDTLKALFAVETGQPLEETRALFVKSHMASESSAQRFRLLLYATSVLLALALIYLGRRLGARGAALRKRAAFEHLIAEHSTRLTNCPPPRQERGSSRPWPNWEGWSRRIASMSCSAKALSGSTIGPRTTRPIRPDGRRRLFRCRASSMRPGSALLPRRMSRGFLPGRQGDASQLRGSRLGLRRVAAPGR